MKRPRTYRIDRADQLKVLSSSVRMEILSVVESLGSCTAKELASATGRAPSSLYFHLGKMTAVDLLGEEESEEGTIFHPTAGSMALAYEPGDPERLELLVRSTSTILRSAERSFRRALQSGEARVHGRRADTRLTSRRARLTSKQIEEVGKHVEAIDRIYAEAQGSDEGRLHGFTVAMAPLAPKTQKRS